MSIKFKSFPENKPKQGDVCLCRCPSWNRVGYDVAVWTGDFFDSSEMPNNLFEQTVIGFAVIEKVDD